MTKVRAARVKVGEYVYARGLPGVQLAVLEVKAEGFRLPILDEVPYRLCEPVEEV